MLKASFIITIVFFISSLTANCQNLGGTWEGSTSGGEYWRIGIVHIGDSCLGYSYDSGPGYCYQNFSAVYNKQENKFKGQGNDFISRSFDHMLIAATLRYEKRGKDEYLVGTVKVKAFIANVFSLGLGSSARLKKIKNDVDSTDYIRSVVRRLPTTKQTDTVKNETVKRDTIVIDTKTNDSIIAKRRFEDSVTNIKNSRTTIVAKKIITQADSVKIVLYDDGEIDGDIVTIFDNGKIVVNKLTLTKAPYQIMLALPIDGAVHTIELMAENEGSIPPNTAYMLVLADDKRIEIKASSDKLSNAAIVIQKSN
ncbi:MAG: hypothetical protein V4685_05605 [Bacteroidota bacterium]